MERERRADEGVVSVNVSSRGSGWSTARGADPGVGGMASPRERL